MFDEKKKEELTNYLNGMRYGRRTKSDGEIYDFMEKLVHNPIPKEEYNFHNPELIKRVRVFFMNHDYPFTVLDNGTEWYLAMRAIKNGR